MSKINEKISPGQKLVLRVYYGEDYKHTYYRNEIHDQNDIPICQISAFEELFDEAKIEDGDEFEIVLVKNGNRPFGDRKYRYQKPHTYAPETDEQMRIRKLTPVLTAVQSD